MLYLDRTALATSLEAALIVATEKKEDISAANVLHVLTRQKSKQVMIVSEIGDKTFFIAAIMVRAFVCLLDPIMPRERSVSSGLGLPSYVIVITISCDDCLS